MIGGSIGYNNTDNSYSDNSGYKSTSNGLNLGLSYAKSYSENVFWGLTASFGYSDYKNVDPNNPASNNNSQTRNFYLGVFCRKYYPIITNLYVFTQTGLGYTNSSSDGSNTAPSKGYNVGIYGYPGISFKASKKIYLETTLNNVLNVDYSHTETNYTATTTYNQNRFSATVQLPTQILQNLNVGMTIILGK